MLDERDSSERIGAMPLSASFMVHRGRMIRDLVVKARRAGIVVISAPNGFGKTSILLQYTEEVRSDPRRGTVRIVEGERSVFQEVSMQLEVLLEELRNTPYALVAIDNMPQLDKNEAEEFALRVRWLRDRRIGVLITCEPGNRELMRALGDSVKVTAQMLKVHAYEYSDWARAFSIPTSLDVYGLTQGVPELVAALQAGIEGLGDPEQLLDNAVTDVYASILAELSKPGNESLMGLVCMMLLVGKGSIADLERCGIAPDAVELSYLVRDYPVFGYEPADRTFECLGSLKAQRRIWRIVRAARPGYVLKATRVLMRSGRIDHAAVLAEGLLERPALRELVRQYPAELALTGHADLISRVLLERSQDEEADEAEVYEPKIEEALALYIASIVRGEMRQGRRMASYLRREQRRIPSEIDSRTWNIAEAASEVWAYDPELRLPPVELAQSRRGSVQRLLEAHKRALGELLEGEGQTAALERLPQSPYEGCEIDIPGLLISCDRLIASVLDGSMVQTDEVDRDIEGIRAAMERRGLMPVSVWMRCAVSARRLFAGQPVVDEQAFCDGGRYAIRAHDSALQLFCTVMEGWQYLMRGQPVNAKFRAVQVLKLMNEGYCGLRQIALLLERTATLRNTSLVTVREEAEMLDLDAVDVTSVEAWSCALHLACAGRDTDLSAWVSMHRAELLKPELRLFARAAMHCLGESAELVRRKLPPSQVGRYVLQDDRPVPNAGQFEIVGEEPVDVVGQVELNLLGGFRAKRDGRLITEKMWHRKKAAILAARLGLVLGSLVDRGVLEQELWPTAECRRARNNLYSTVSVLRKTLGSGPDGTSSVVLQDGGIGLSVEIVHTDVSRFDQIAREILVRKSGVSGPHLVELCLKLEQIYVGPLYVPSGCDATFFMRQRRVIQSKFIDCMIKGALAALKENDLQSAVWLVESGLRQDSSREDMLRAGMRVYDLAGRRRDIVDIYNGHLHHLKDQVAGLPEPETRELYERIVEHRMKRGIV